MVRLSSAASEPDRSSYGEEWAAQLRNGVQVTRALMAQILNSLQRACTPPQNDIVCAGVKVDGFVAHIDIEQEQV